MGQPTPAVSVIVPARDAETTLARTLDALGAQRLDVPYEVIVVDDGSRDATAEIVRAHSTVARLAATRGGEGPGAARDRGADEARAPVLAFTDADCFPTTDWLARGLAALEDVDLVQGAVEPDPTAARTPFDRTVMVDRERGLYQTANLLVRRSVFDGVGGFHDWVLEEDAARRRTRRATEDRRRGRARRTPIGEDTVFAWAARRQGARTAFAADAVVHHAVVPGALRDELEDRWHWGRDMPGLAARVPELRDTCFYRRVFFHRRTADFDLAVASVLASMALRRPWPLAGVVPYVRWIATAGGRAAAGTALADAVTCAALATGSVTRRTVLL